MNVPEPPKENCQYWVDWDKKRICPIGAGFGVHYRGIGDEFLRCAENTGWKLFVNYLWGTNGRLSKKHPGKTNNFTAYAAPAEVQNPY